MGSIQGRDTDIVVTPSGNRLIRTLLYRRIRAPFGNRLFPGGTGGARVDRLTSGSCNRIFLKMWPPGLYPIYKRRVLQISLSMLK